MREQCVHKNFDMPVDSSIITAMLCKNFYFHRRILGFLIGVWLFLGGVAFAEQLHIMPETSLADEEALESFQLAVKSETLDASIVVTFVNLLAPSVIVPLNAAVASVLSNLIYSFSDFAYTRSLPRFTCCYRI